MNLSKLQSEAVKEFETKFLRPTTDIRSNGQFVDEVRGRLPDLFEQFLSDQIDIAYSKGREETIKQIRKMETDSYSLKGAYFNENIDFICKKLLSIQSKGKIK